MTNIQTILHPTDFSDHAAIAFEMAQSLARTHGAKLVVAHVAPPPTYIYGEGIVPPEPERAYQVLRERLAEIKPSDASTPIQHVLLEGDTVEEILRAAEDTRADLVVIGTHGRGALMRVLLGSVAEQIVRRAPCPVLTVRKPAAAKS